VEFIVDLVLAVASALLGGIVALRLRQPALVGYLLGGVVFGPHGLGLIHSAEAIDAFAQVGVALLLFAIGVEFDLRTLAAVGRVAIGGGVLQIAVTTLIVAPVGLVVGASLGAALIFGNLIALSSTMAALKILDERGETDSLHGRIATGILIIQDLSVVPVTVLLPIVSQAPERLFLALGVAAAKATLLLFGTYLLAARALPWALLRIAAARSRELFILMIVTLALGTAFATEELGLSIAFGAFLAGLIVGRSEVGHRALSETLPLRDVFAAIFFVSVGTLIDPRFLLANLGIILPVAAAVVVLKLVVTTGVVRGFGFDGRTSIAVGLALTQVGEFSLVLGQVAVREHVLSADQYAVLLAVTLATIVATAPLQAAGPPLLRWLRVTPGLGRWFAEPLVPHLGESPLTQHIVICGFGRVGGSVAEVLRTRGFRYLVVDLNPHVIADLRREGIPCIYGDAVQPAVLAHAGLERARGLACTVPDAGSAEAIVRAARSVYPRIDVIARARDAAALPQLRTAGATEVVYPEFEAGLEFIRHILHRYGVSLAEIQALLQAQRTAQYEPRDGEE
jgi:monovalent cation:H+ antiporter-2, CPA2 family